MTEVRIPLLTRPLARLASHMTFQQQLSLVVAIGVLSMTLLSSLASAWQASRQVEDNLLKQSLQVASSLANQSQLALLSGAPDNAGDALAATLAFPDVLRIEIRNTSGKLLVARGLQNEGSPDWPAPPTLPQPAPHSAFVAAQDAHTWHLVAPVWTTRSASPFDVEPPPEEQLGHVVLSVSKATLSSTVTNIFLTNVVSSLVIALVFLGVLRWLADRLNRPLQALSKAMARAEQGAVQVRTTAQGPRDLQRMSHAFNRMLAALQERGEELQRHRDNLGDLVRERTEELKVEKERAEVASQAKTDFLTRMSHELRTPLNAIMGYAQILEMDRELTGRQRRIVQTMHESGDHLLKLIIDILDLSRIESGHTELHAASVQPRALADQLDNALRIKAAEKALTLLTHCDDQVPQAVLVDDQRLRQVLFNLLGNALKFTAHGTVRLDILCLSATPEGDAATLRFSVQDSGPGIRAEDQARVFEPFEQAGDARSRAQGTGLGLAISRQLVRLMGGELHLRSQEGQGCCFWFDLPLPTVAATPAPASVFAGVFASVTGYEGPRRLVLIADDVATNRHVLVELLRPLGFDTLEARDGAEAVQLHHQHHPDLVLMDLAMPVMDGLEATRQICAQTPAPAHAPQVIALTANASPAHRAQALQAGASAFLSKPFDRMELLSLIAQGLELTWRHDANPTPESPA
ncbi:MAG: response regulator [Burkholderiales bacterium]|nr:response regulator [Burkholderiales bacterium]MBH2014873.1 response regulator [Burkholderiales bacterium]